MAAISIVLLVTFGFILLCVILAVITKIICRIGMEDGLDCYMDFLFDVLLQTLILGDSLIASILITDDNFSLIANQSTKSRAHLIIIFSSINIGLILFKLIWPSIPTPSKQRAYDAKVREVRQAQLKLMEHHNKARRVGVRDVSRKRAKQIAQKKQKEQQQQTEKEKIQRRTIRNDIYEKKPTKQEELNMSVQLSVLPSSLPPEWKVYYNNDGIPYYYNATTGETTWKHPNETSSADNMDPTIPSMNAPRPMESDNSVGTSGKSPKLFRNKTVDTVLVVKTVTRSSLKYFHRWFPCIAGFADEVFDIVAAIALLDGIIFSVDIKLFIILSTYIGAFIELVVLCSKIHARFATFKRIQAGECTCIPLLGFGVLMEFIGLLFECGVGLYLLFAIIGTSNAILFYFSVVIYFIIGLIAILSLPFIFRGICIGAPAQEPIYRDN